MRRNLFLYKCAVLAAMVTSFSALTALFTMSGRLGMQTACLPVWLICTLLCLAATELCAWRGEHTSDFYIRIEILFFVLQTAGTWALRGRPSSVMAAAAACGMWLYSYAQVYKLLTEELKAQKLRDAVDLSVFVTLMGLSASELTEQPAYAFFPCAVSAALALLALAAFRLPAGPRSSVGRQGKGLLVALCGGLILLAGGLSAVGGASLRQTVLFLRDCLTAALRWLGNTVNSFLLWLMSLFPAPETETGGEAMEGFSLGGGPVEMPENRGIGIYLILALAAVLILIAVVWLLRNAYRIRSSRGKKTPAAVRKRLDRAEENGRLSARLAAWLRYFVNRFRFRDTARGMLVWTDRRMRVRKQGRKKDETVREFLLRAAAVYPGAEEDLGRLITAVECELYGGCAIYTPAEAAMLRRRIRRSIIHNNDRGERNEN